MLKGKAIAWSKYTWNIDKWRFGKLMSLTF